MKFEPLVNNSRIKAVDALRGFALLGILLANIPFSNKVALAGELDSTMTFIFHFLLDKKFISIFSILFGFGFYNQMKRAETANVNFKKYFLFRMVLLYAIGSTHAFILWNGDILRAFALGGFVLVFIRNWPIKRLLFIALFFTIVITGIVFIGNNSMGWRNYSYDYALATELPLTTSYFRYLTINAIMDPWVNFMKDMPLTLAFTFGNMTMGFVLAKSDFFRLPETLNKLTTLLILQGITVGFASSYIYTLVVSGEINLDNSLWWLPFVVITGMVLQSLMYISVFLRLFQIKAFNWLLSHFIPTGRMALSNYILQSVLYLFVFFHCTHTFQLFGKLTLAQTNLVAILFFVFQTGLSTIWLRNHTQGPLEYIWKKISYGKVKPKKHRNENI